MNFLHLNTLIDACEDIQSLITQLTIYHSILKFKYKKLNSFFQMLLLRQDWSKLKSRPRLPDAMQFCNFQMNRTFLRTEIYIYLLEH